MPCLQGDPRIKIFDLRRHRDVQVVGLNVTQGTYPTLAFTTVLCIVYTSPSSSISLSIRDFGSFLHKVDMFHQLFGHGISILNSLALLASLSQSLLNLSLNLSQSFSESLSPLGTWVDSCTR